MKITFVLLFILLVLGCNGAPTAGNSFMVIYIGSDYPVAGVFFEQTDETTWKLSIYTVQDSNNFYEYNLKGE